MLSVREIAMSLLLLCSLYDGAVFICFTSLPLKCNHAPCSFFRFLAGSGSAGVRTYIGGSHLLRQPNGMSGFFDLKKFLRGASKNIRIRFLFSCWLLFVCDIQFSYCL